MRIDRMLRWATLVAILAALAPAPAEAQLGRFIKNKLKEKIAKAAVEAVVPADTPVTGAPAAGQGAAPGTAKKAAPGRAVKGGEAPAPASGLTFSEYLPEMTPEVLDRLEKGLAAESAERQAVAKQLARVLSKDAYSDCMQKYVMSPEGQRVHKAIFPEGGGMNKAAMEENVRLIEKKCGPDPSTLGTLKNQLAGKPGEAGLAASGFNYNQ